MKRLIRWCVSVAALVLGCGTAFGGQMVPMNPTEPTSGIHVECSTPLRSTPRSGFCPIHFKIHNGTADPHTWEVTFSTSAGLNMGSRVQLAAAPNQTREWDLLIPRPFLESNEGWYETLQGSIRGYGIVRDRFTIPSQYSGGPHTAFVVMSETLANANWSKLEAAIKTPVLPSLRHPALFTGRFPGMSRSGRNLRGSQVDLRDLPADWRAYSGFAGLWLSKGDWEKLPSDQRRSIRQWILAGGHLFVASSDDQLKKLPLLPEKLMRGQNEVLGFGAVKAVKLVAADELPMSETASDVLGLDDALLPAWKSDYESGWRLASFVGWPQLRAPLVIGFVCLFGLVIGPINLRWLAPPQRRHRLFLTIPLLSASASLMLFGVIAISDGFGGTGGRNAIVYLPAGENQATILQEQIARSRLLLARSFKLPEPVQLSFSKGRRETNGTIGLERSGPDVSGDWFRSRSVQTHVLRANVPSRAEVILQSDPAATATPPVLLSSVGAPLEDVIYIDAAGGYWRASGLDTGRPTTLEKTTSEAWTDWKLRRSGSPSPHMQAMLEEIGNRPGHFYAGAHAIPEAPIETLPSIRWDRQMVICFGPCTKGEGR